MADGSNRQYSNTGANRWLFLIFFIALALLIYYWATTGSWPFTGR